MNPLQKEKLKRFANDKVLFSTVHDVLLQSFLRDYGGDIQVLAASRIAINYLADGFKELERFKNEVVHERKELEQIGM